MRFLVDAQLPPALARKLEALGHVAEHVADQGMASASDDAIRHYAAGVGAVIVTKDEDFAVRRLLADGPSVVWLRVGNTRTPTVLLPPAPQTGEFALLERTGANPGNGS